MSNSSLNEPEPDSRPSPQTKSKRWALNPRQTVPTANAYLEQFHHHEEGRTLHNFGETMLEWRDGCYRPIEESALTMRVQNWLHGCKRVDPDGKTKPFDSNPSTVKATITTLKAQAFLSLDTPIPSWLGAPPDELDARDLVPCRSQLLHVPSNSLFPATPRFFCTCALDFDPNPDAPIPRRWAEFLHQLFDGDQERMDLLQEWFGYCLVGDTSQQKMMLIVGPKRSGKGTISRILQRLVGLANACGPTVSSLAGPFGLQPLVGKSLAVVSDARFHGESISTVVERLLCISGEDLITVDRKYMSSLHLKLSVRFMFLANEFPKFTDASTALARRFVILQLHHSFFGREDPHLTDRLCEELPGILNWAIEGLQRLRKRGRFQMPSASQEAIEDLEYLSSPIKGFVCEQCVLGADLRVFLDDIFAAWNKWCEVEGISAAGSRADFGRNLKAAFPEITRRRTANQISFYQGIGLKEAPK